MGLASCPLSYFPEIKYMHDPEPSVLKLLGHPTVELPQRWNGQDPVNIWKWKEVRVQLGGAGGT